MILKNSAFIMHLIIKQNVTYFAKVFHQAYIHLLLM